MYTSECEVGYRCSSYECVPLSGDDGDDDTASAAAADDDDGDDAPPASLDRNSTSACNVTSECAVGYRCSDSVCVALSTTDDAAADAPAPRALASAAAAAARGGRRDDGGRDDGRRERRARVTAPGRRSELAFNAFTPQAVTFFTPDLSDFVRRWTRDDVPTLRRRYAPSSLSLSQGELKT